MAVFFINNCTYPECRRKFSCLSDLIYHIEDTHLDFDPPASEERERQKLQSVPLSYILKYSHYSHESNQLTKLHDNSTLTLTNRHGSQKAEAKTSLSEQDPVLIESEISDDSWNDDISNDVLFNNYFRKKLDSENQKVYNVGKAKKFVCTFPGCNKKYKNINGIRYHIKNGHDSKISSIKSKKMHKCHCGKLYKTQNGLKAHSSIHKQQNNINIYKQTPPDLNSPMFSTQKALHTQHSYSQGDANNNFVYKTDVKNEDILTCSYLENTPHLSDAVDNVQSHSGHNFSFFVPPYSCNNPMMNENFNDNDLMTEDTGINQNYSLTFPYRKY